MNTRRYIMVALLAAAIALLLRQVMIQSESTSKNNTPGQPANTTESVTNAPTFLELAPKPAAGGNAGATNNLPSTSGSNPAPAAEIAETTTNVPGSDTNQAGAPAPSSQLVKPPWTTPPPPDVPPIGLGMTNPPVVMPPAQSRPYVPPSP
jgi:hypothetical protein